MKTLDGCFMRMVGNEILLSLRISDSDLTIAFNYGGLRDVVEGKVRQMDGGAVVDSIDGDPQYIKKGAGLRRRTDGIDGIEVDVLNDGVQTTWRFVPCP